MDRTPPRPATRTSLTLIERLRDPTDERAWVEFNERYRELIWRFLRRRGLQVADAEDVSQLVIGKLVRGMSGFEYDPARGGFRAYLFRCARSALADHFSRQASRGKTVSLREDGGAASSNDDDAFEIFEREWVDHHYRRAVQRYREGSDERANVILDGTIAGQTARVIGEGLGLSEAAVHKAQQRLRERLRELIGEQVRDEEFGGG